MPCAGLEASLSLSLHDFSGRLSHCPCPAFRVTEAQMQSGSPAQARCSCCATVHEYEMFGSSAHTLVCVAGATLDSWVGTGPHDTFRPARGSNRAGNVLDTDMLRNHGDTIITK